MRVQWRWMVLTICFVLSCTAMVARGDVSGSAVQIVPAGFESIVAQMKRSAVPLVLPSQSPFPVFPYLRPDDGTGTGYEIALDGSADCHGAGYCNSGLLSGAAITQSSPSIASKYAFLSAPDYNPVARSPEIMGPIALSHGITGFFVPYACGANCDTSKVVWDQGGYRYTVGIRSGVKAAVVALANSAIENEQSQE